LGRRSPEPGLNAAALYAACREAAAGQPEECGSGRMGRTE